jgi:hypothetical protein
LLFREWRLRRGPDWDDSLRAADPGDGYFTDSIDSARLVLERDPYWHTTPFLHDRDDLRVLRTADERAGYAVMVFVALERATATVELRWAERAPLDDH